MASDPPLTFFLDDLPPYSGHSENKNPRDFSVLRSTGAI
jgi:hypothetical protein